MEKVTKINWINKVKKDERSSTQEINDMLKVMLQDILHNQQQYQNENKIFYEKVDEQLTEIKGLVTYTLTEQEKLKIKTATLEELSRLIIDNQLEIRKSIDKIAGDKNE